MTLYDRLLLERPRPERIPKEAIADLLRDAGVVDPSASAPSGPALERVAAETGAPTPLIASWLSGEQTASYRDLTALALALDRHPEFSRRVRVDSPPSARSMKTQMVGAPRASAPSASIEKPASPAAPAARAAAPPPPAAPSTPPAPRAVAPESEPAPEGIEVTIGSGATEGYDAADFRSWLAAWLAQRFAPPISVLLGPHNRARGVDADLVLDAFDEYKELTRKGVWSAGHALLNAVADWGNDPTHRERHASLVRVAALRIVEVAETHRELFRLDLTEEAALRRVAEAQPDTWHQAIREQSSRLFACGRRIMDAWGRPGNGSRARSGTAARGRSSGREKSP